MPTQITTHASKANEAERETNTAGNVLAMESIPSFPKLPINSSLISLDIGGTLIKVVYLVKENKNLY
jgi:hexokinase